jgi:hypothetical protein
MSTTIFYIILPIIGISFVALMAIAAKGIKKSVNDAVARNQNIKAVHKLDVNEFVKKVEFQDLKKELDFLKLELNQLGISHTHSTSQINDKIDFVTNKAEMTSYLATLLAKTINYPNKGTFKGEIFYHYGQENNTFDNILLPETISNRHFQNPVFGKSTTRKSVKTINIK